MSHHYSTISPGPQSGFPYGTPASTTPICCFPKPGDPSKSILMMDVHPSFDVINAGPTTAEPFAAEGSRDQDHTDGDAIAVSPTRLRFASRGGGAQTATLRRLEARRPPDGRGAER